MLSMESLALTGSTQVKIRTLNAFVAEPFHTFVTAITCHSNVLIAIPYIKKQLLLFMKRVG